MVELGGVLGDVAHGKLGLRLSEPDVGPCLPELKELEHDGVDLVCHGGGDGLTSRSWLGRATREERGRDRAIPGRVGVGGAAARRLHLRRVHVTSRKSSQSVGVTNEARSKIEHVYLLLLRSAE